MYNKQYKIINYLNAITKPIKSSHSFKMTLQKSFHPMHVYRYKRSFTLFQGCIHIGYAFTAAGQWRFLDTNNPPAPQALKN
jgi:hypothetical protein